MRLGTATALMVLGGSLYTLWRAFAPAKVMMAPAVKSRLPLAKNLNTIEDNQGNYDMDGVSFDTNGVVVSGDGNKLHHVAPPAGQVAATETTSESQLH